MIIINGNIHESDSSEKIILDSGYYFGRGVFETILIKGVKPLFLKQHVDRLKRGMNTLNIQNSINEEYIIDIISRNKLNDCVIKIVVTEKNIVISTRQVTYKPEDYINGFSVKISTMKRNPYSHVTYLKSINYTDNILEKEQATKEGFNEVLFLNTRGEIAESSTSNVFFVKSGKIYTPEIKCGILDGIVREWVIEKFDVCEGQFYREDLEQADEVFLTNSVMGIMKVNLIEGVKSYNKSLVYENVKDVWDRQTDTFSQEVAQ